MGCSREAKDCEQGHTESSLGEWPGTRRADSASGFGQQAQKGTAEMSAACLLGNAWHN